MVEEDSQLHVQWSPRRHHSSVYFQVLAFLVIIAYSSIILSSVVCCLSLCMCLGIYVGHGRSGS